MKPVIAMPKLSNDPFRIYMKSKYVLSLWRTGARVRWIGNENIIHISTPQGLSFPSWFYNSIILLICQ